MKRTILIISSIVLMASFLGACTRQDYGTVGGGVVGAAAGNVLTGGSALGTVAGAAGGAFVGNQLSK